MQSMDDINYLKSLTYSTSTEDFLAAPLLSPLSSRELTSHIRRHQESPPDANSPDGMKLYVHMPYCATICSFCNCRRIQLKDADQLKQFVSRVERQINTMGPLFKKTQFRSFHFLGGTVPVLDAKSLEHIIKKVLNNFSFSKSARFLLEGHPKRLEPHKLALARKLGINQISLGIQSMDPSVLKEINRHQTKQDVISCIRNIKDLGFDRLDTDIVPGLPHQTISSFIDDIKTLIDLEVDIIHINPFSNITESQYGQNHAIDISSIISRRNTMILKAKDLLEEHGYSQKGFNGYQRLGIIPEENEQEAICPGNILGLGLFAKSNLGGELLFEDLPSSADNPTPIRYKGYAITPRYTMAAYAQLYLLKGLKRSAFKLLFGQDIESAFDKDFPSLINTGLIVKDQDTYRYNGPWTIQGLFDYYAYTKILLSSTILRDLKQRQKGNHHTDQYLVVRLLQDLSFVRTYYNLGQKTCWLSS